MTEKFENLDQEKRERILNAAMAEFALRGYEKASTNEIVKNAGISKGLLFHYFKSKKQLFLYLYDFILALMQDELFKRIDYVERDLFKNMRRISMAKLDLQKQYPDVFNFMLEAYMETYPEIQEELSKRNTKALSFNMAKLFQDTDTSKLREDITLTEALNIISWSIEGMVNEELRRSRLLNQSMDYKLLFSKADMYFDKFEKLFYKGGQ